MSDFTPFQATGHLASGVPRCPECPVGVPSLFPSQNGTSRKCPVLGCVVSRAPRSKGAGHGTGHGTARLARRASLTVHQCGAHVLVGLDADRCALVARVEPYPLTALGEVEALRAGRWTYRLLQGALDRRDRWNIPGKPPTAEVPVLAEHVCGQPLPATWLAPPPPRRPTAPTEEIPW